MASWNAEYANKWGPLVSIVVSCLGRESAELLHLPAPGGFLEQPGRTMAAVGVVQEVFSERLRQEYQKAKKSGKRV